MTAIKGNNVTGNCRNGLMMGHIIDNHYRMLFA